MEVKDLERKSIAADIMRKLGIPGTYILRFNKTGEVITYNKDLGGYSWSDSKEDRQVVAKMQEYGRTVYAIVDGPTPAGHPSRTYLYVSKGDAARAHQNLMAAKPLLDNILVPVEGRKDVYEVKAYVVFNKYSHTMPVRVTKQEDGLAIVS